MATEDSKCTTNLGRQDTLILNILITAVVAPAGPSKDMGEAT
jgi:hypothetical protein